jgi:pseudouridine-5'-monophosphatase
MSIVPKAVLFDLDGVLLDTEPLYTQATQAVTSQYGRDYDFALKRQVMGGSAIAGAKVIIEALGLPLSPEEYLAQRRLHLEQLFRTAPPIEGAEQLVSQLATYRLPLAVATSSERSLFELKTRPHSWFSLFTKVICGDDPRIAAPKPAPDIFQLAAAELGVRADECLVFEDSPAGVAAAHAAGATVIARRNPALSAENLAIAQLVVTRYDELDLKDLLQGKLTRRTEVAS